MLTEILSLRRVIEGVKEKNLEAVISFFDFPKASHCQNQHQEKKVLRGRFSTISNYQSTNCDKRWCD